MPAADGLDTVILQPKRKEAEHADGLARHDTGATPATPTAAATPALVGLGDGDWAPYEPGQLHRHRHRHASAWPRRPRAARSSCARTRRRATLLGTAHGAATRAARSRWRDVTVPAPRAARETMGLFLVFKGTANFRLNFIEFNGKGLSPDDAPDGEDHVAGRERGGRARARSRSRPTATDAENDDHQGRVLRRRRRRSARTTTAPYSVDWTQTTEEFYVVHAVATNDQGPDQRLAQGRASPSASRHPARRGTTFANVDARLRPARRRRSRSAPRAPTCGRAPTSTAPSTCPAAWARTSSRTVKVDVVRRHAHERQGGHHGPQRHDRRAAAAHRLPRVRREGQRRGRVHARRRRQRPGQQHRRAGRQRVRHGQRADVAEGEEVRTRSSSSGARATAPTWTQVGHDDDPVGRGDAGHRPVRRLAHRRARRRTAKFTDWSLDTDVEPPEDPASPRRRAPATLSDEFDGAARRRALDHGPRRRPPSAAARVAAGHQRRHRRHQHRARSPTSARRRRRATGRRRPRSRSSRTTSGSTPACSCTSTTTTTRS